MKISPNLHGEAPGIGSLRDGALGHLEGRIGNLATSELTAIDVVGRARSPLAAPVIPAGPWRQFGQVLTDTCIVVLTYLAITYVRFMPIQGGVQVEPYWGPLHLPPYYGSALCLYALIFLLAGIAQGLYRVDHQFPASEEYLLVLKSAGLSALLFSVFLFALHVDQVSRLVVGLTAALGSAVMVLWRVWRREVAAQRIAAGIGIRNVLIVGTGHISEQVSEYLTRHRNLGHRVVGFLSQHPSDRPEILGQIEDLPWVARFRFVDEVIVTTPLPRVVLRRAIRLARKNNLDVKIVPDLYGFSRGVTISQLGKLPVMSIRRPVPATALVVKRMIDVAGSCLGLIMLSPLLVVIAILIKLDSSGPVLYRSIRVGKKASLFTFYKFRTMVPNADLLKAKLEKLNQRDHILFKIPNDPRITRLGSFLRRYSLDELPQLWNVLRGDMSLVGPRPAVVEEYEKYKLEYRGRLDALPGITGLWQITARHDPSFETYIRLDLQYIENWSLWLDMKILLRTLGSLFQGRGN
jgi:exopolysaccharide biosynthesis polyprenyl glycosylphosphotransferase